MIRFLDEDDHDTKEILLILRKPDCGEVAPAQLADDDITTVRESIANFYRMVSAFAVIFIIFLIFGHYGSRMGRVGTVRHDNRCLTVATQQ